MQQEPILHVFSNHMSSGASAAHSAAVLILPAHTQVKVCRRRPPRTRRGPGTGGGVTSRPRLEAAPRAPDERRERPEAVRPEAPPRPARARRCASRAAVDRAAPPRPSSLLTSGGPHPSAGSVTRGARRGRRCSE
jgi:hypothetical protein